MLAAVTHNGRQLVMTFVLMSVVIYMYTIISFNFFRGQWSQDDTVRVWCGVRSASRL